LPQLVTIPLVTGGLELRGATLLQGLTIPPAKPKARGTL
jgi:hypothetical protein